MRLMITLIFLISFTFAQSTVNITSDTSSITDFKLDYFIDKTAKMNFEVDEKGVLLSKQEKDLLDYSHNILDGSDAIFKFTL